ncbi:hypothetical protein QBC35DRAFT_265480 [Podospora australis]|uniref:Uncharacterized protein n=1 Tax=Podospora australis TaxID=1536484 RepID=A0AAN6WQV5_9PEZI|nr:hypothetical protein QBC35DRAFT_265480 [Podospora australis]
MANNQPQTGKDGQSAEEEKLEDALHHLNKLHLQLRQLRSAPIRMLEPLTTKQPTPEAMYATFTQSVENTHKELASFRDSLNHAETRAVFLRVSDSQKRDCKNLKQWRARDDPNWADPEPKRVKTS